MIAIISHLETTVYSINHLKLMRHKHSTQPPIKLEYSTQKHHVLIHRFSRFRFPSFQSKNIFRLCQQNLCKTKKNLEYCSAKAQSIAKKYHRVNKGKQKST